MILYQLMMYSISNVIATNFQSDDNSNSIHPDNRKAPEPYAAATNSTYMRATSQRDDLSYQKKSKP